MKERRFGAATSVNNVFYRPLHSRALSCDLRNYNFVVILYYLIGVAYKELNFHSNNSSSLFT